jgi:hypothetical protein
VTPLDLVQAFSGESLIAGAVIDLMSAIASSRPRAEWFHTTVTHHQADVTVVLSANFLGKGSRRC